MVLFVIAMWRGQQPGRERCCQGGCTARLGQNSSAPKYPALWGESAVSCILHNPLHFASNHIVVALYDYHGDSEPEISVGCMHSENCGWTSIPYQPINGYASR